MTLTIEIPKETETQLREAMEQHDMERLRQVLGDLATPAALSFFENDPLEKALALLRQRTPAEALAAQTTARAALVPPVHALPQGKTLGQTLEGHWPGEETDEQVYAALQKLS
jgi:hypothetical protein